MLQLVVGIHTAPTKEEIFARLVAAVNGTGLELVYSELEEPRQPDGVAIFTRLPKGHESLTGLPDIRSGARW